MMFVVKRRMEEYIGWFILSLLLVFMYLSTFRWMYGRFTAEDTYYSHGFLIPFVCGFFVWQRRDEFIERQNDYSWTGFFFIVVALLIHFGSTVLYVFFTSGISILILAFGISLFLYGKRSTRAILFPLSYLAFMLPLPGGIINAIAYPMKLGIASVSATLAQGLGFPILQNGFFIDTAGGTLLIDNPCSGLRSLIAFLALGSILAYITPTTLPRKTAIFFSSVPIAFFTNIIRVLFLILVSHYYGVPSAMPGGLPHDISGYVVFIVGGVMLFGLGRVLECKQ